MTFKSKLSQAQKMNDSWLCIGLDPVRKRLPQAVLASDNPLFDFGHAIVEATTDLACAYKPNLGFWLTEGPDGLKALQDLIAEIPDSIPVILDGKFNDIGHTADAYAYAAFETLAADAITANPYLGMDGIRPFLDNDEYGAFLLARTSNSSAPDLQDLNVGARSLYEEVALLATEWDDDLPGTCGLVVGATYPDELERLRQTALKLPFLIPGIGAQSGNLVAAVAHGPTSEGLGPVINSSRGIIYASSGPDFAEAARAAALNLRDRINVERL